MTLPEILNFIEKLETRNNSYWNFYTVVIVAICGWVISQLGNTISPQIMYALMLGNAIFYFMNLSVIYGTTSRIEVFEDELMILAESDQQIGSVLRKYLSKPFLKNRLKFTIATHLVMDVAVILFIFLGLKS